MPYDFQALDPRDRRDDAEDDDDDGELTIPQAVGFTVLSSAVLVVRPSTCDLRTPSYALPTLITWALLSALLCYACAQVLFFFIHQLIIVVIVFYCLGATGALHHLLCIVGARLFPCLHRQVYELPCFGHVRDPNCDATFRGPPSLTQRCSAGHDLDDSMLPARGVHKLSVVLLPTRDMGLGSAGPVELRPVHPDPFIGP